MLTTYDNYRAEFENNSLEQGIRILRHDLGHELLHVLGYCEVLLEELPNCTMDEVIDRLKAIHGRAQTSQDIFHAFTDPYLKVDQE